MTPSERLTTGFLLALAALAGALRPPGREWLALAFGAQAGLTVLLSRLGARSWGWSRCSSRCPRMPC